jgi:hypothetical protein
VILGSLGDLGNDKTSRNIWYPVCKFYSVCSIVDAYVHREVVAVGDTVGDIGDASSCVCHIYSRIRNVGFNNWNCHIEERKWNISRANYKEI